MNEAQDYRPDPEVIVTELDTGEAVLLHLGTRMYYSLNETGLRIWALLSDGLTTTEIAERLISTYEVTSENAERSVVATIEHLRQEKLVLDRSAE